MKENLLLIICFIITCTASAQTTYDIVTYKAPSGWQEKQGNNYISYTRVDGGNWAQIGIYRQRSCAGDIQADFDQDWNELVANNKTVSSPEKKEPKTERGWTVMSGSGVWQYKGADVVSVLTVYSNGSVCVAVLYNATAKSYLKDYQALIGSLNLNAGNAKEKSNNPAPGATAPAANNQVKSSIAGLWTSYLLETSGYMNGTPQYSGGYLRSEYLLKENGTYVYRVKNWLVYGAKDILFVYETGTYTFNGNQITFTPKQGKGGWWQKTKSTKEWGPFVKGSTDYKTEKKICSFEIQNSSDADDAKLILKTGGQEYSYKKRTDNSIIDNPPGFKTDF